ncbi:MAG: DUF1501 domain-containing protein [Planctomyces sp.]|nr:DUF1501 domain-containing protein [Planctomyces sp.]
MRFRRHAQNHRSPLNRRDAMLRMGSVVGSGLTLQQLLAAERTTAQQDSARTATAEQSVPGTHKGKAKSCIFLFMWGGQPQQDMWDMKPDAPVGIRSPFRPVQTNVPGLQLSDQLPLTARHADRLAIIRSLTHSATDHGVSVYHTLTGRAMVPPRTFPSNGRRRTDFPSVGSMFSYLGEPTTTPASFTIPRPVAHDGLFYAGTHAGFLGAPYDPVEIGQVFNHVQAGPRSDPPSIPLTLPDDVSLARLKARRGLRELLEASDRMAQKSGAPGPPGSTETFQRSYESAFQLLHSANVREALDLSGEPSNVRELYGRNEYGDSFLTARRLIEAGVRIVTVNWMFITPAAKVYNVWDAHGGLNDLEHGQTGYGMLRANYCLPSFDRAFSALLTDLTEHGLLDETVVACAGEFGRTPTINGNNGRDHWPFCYSAVLAGGGVQGGAIYGSSDKQAAYVKENPVTPGDYLATVCAACGLDPATEVHDLDGRPYRICDGEPISAIL